MKLLLLLLTSLLSGAGAQDTMYFNRVNVFYPCSQDGAECNSDNETVAEIVDASPDGMTLVYTDGTQGRIGFIDIADLTNPLPMGTVDVGGEPTSVAVTKDGLYAVVAVNTSPDFVNPSGVMHAIRMDTMEVVVTTELGGQPDSIAISADNAYMAIVIENERDEDLGEGGIPQLPGGYVIVVDKTAEDPSEWTMQNVNLTEALTAAGVDFPEDPEPEYIAINAENVAVVTIQENNGIALIDLATATVLGAFSAGAVDLEMIDSVEDNIIDMSASLSQIPREPDTVAWIGTEFFATANEGDLNGGSRGFTIFDRNGTVVFDIGNAMEHDIARIGQYPEGRSEAKGNEPEGLAYGVFGDENLLFVMSERASVVLVYSIADPSSPTEVTLKQILPSEAGPEGIVLIPSRNMVAIATETDERGNTIRATVGLYEMRAGEPIFPHLTSADREDGTPIPFGALSGLACGDAPGLSNPLANTVFTIEDSFYNQSRMFEIDTSTKTLTREIRLMDSNGALAAVSASQVNDDMTVSLDNEGIALADDGTFWIVSEGAGTVGDPEEPLESANLLLHVTAEGEIVHVYTLPEEVNAIQVRFGFEGVAAYGDYLVVAFQRAWGEEANPRIGIFNKATEEWKFVFYPLDEVKSQNGGWVGLSDIAPMGSGMFMVLERDNQGKKNTAT